MSVYDPEFRYAWSDLKDDTAVADTGAEVDYGADAVTGHPHLTVTYKGDTLRLELVDPDGGTWDAGDYLLWRTTDPHGDTIAYDQEPVGRYSTEGAEYPVSEALTHLAKTFLDLHE